MLTKKQMRTIGYSTAKTALKMMPKWTKSPLTHIRKEIANNKTCNEALRECKPGAEEGLKEGMLEAFVEWQTKVPTKIFNKYRQANELLKESGTKGHYDEDTGVFSKDD